MNEGSSEAPRHGVYGLPPDDLSGIGPEAMQFSPLVPGARDLAAVTPGTLASLAMLAPPGTAERQYAIASGLQALAPGAPFTILAPRDRGGARLAQALGAFGCTVQDDARRHHRICHGLRPERLLGIEAALSEGGPRYLDGPGLWSQPGIFSWDRIDPGSALLMRHLPAGLTGRGADFGGGLGLLSRAALTSPAVTSLTLIEIDRRAVEAARRNVPDPRLTPLWADVRSPAASLAKLDFVVMNPPFHDSGHEDRTLGQTFIRRAAGSLRKGGALWLIANRHLPYEAVLKPLFKQVRVVVEAAGFKIFEARL